MVVINVYSGMILWNSCYSGYLNIFSMHTPRKKEIHKIPIVMLCAIPNVWVSQTQTHRSPGVLGRRSHRNAFTGTNYPLTNLEAKSQTCCRGWRNYSSNCETDTVDLNSAIVVSRPCEIISEINGYAEPGAVHLNLIFPRWSLEETLLRVMDAR